MLTVRTTEHEQQPALAYIAFVRQELLVAVERKRKKKKKFIKESISGIR